MSSFTNANAGRGNANAGRGNAIAGRGNVNAGRGNAIAGRGNVNAGRGNANAGRENNIFFFNDRIKDRRNDADVEVFRREYDELSNLLCKIIWLSENDFVVNEDIQKAIYWNLYVKFIQQSMLLKKILESQKVPNLDPTIFSSKSVEGAFGSVSIIRSNKLKNDPILKECLANGNTIVKQYFTRLMTDRRKDDPLMIFRVLQENYLQYILNKDGPSYTDSTGKVHKVVPRPSCIRMTESGGYVSFMEKLEGGELFDKMISYFGNKPSMDKLFIQVFIRLSETIELLQRDFHFVHGDLSPHNIFIHPNRNVHIIDFGGSMIRIPGKEMVIAPYPELCVTKYKFGTKEVDIGTVNNSIVYDMSVITGTNIYYDYPTIKSIIGPSAVNIYEIIWKSQDFFYAFNHIMMENVTQIIGAYYQVITKDVQNERISMPSPTASSEEKSRVYDEIRGKIHRIVMNCITEYIYSHSVLNTSQFVEKVVDLFYTYRYTDSTGKDVYINLFMVMCETYAHYFANLYIDALSSLGSFGGYPMNVKFDSYYFFKYTLPGPLDFVNDLIIPECVKILESKGITRNGNGSEYNRLLFVEVYEMIRGFRSRFIPVEVRRGLNHIYKSLYRNPAAAAAATATAAPPSKPKPKRVITWRNSVVTNPVGGLTNVFEIPTKEVVKELTMREPGIGNSYELSQRLTGSRAQRSKQPYGLQRPPGKQSRLYGNVEEKNITTLAQRLNNAVRKRRKPSNNSAGSKPANV